ncbi:MAG: hypothetical protein FP826_02860 [Sphingomonadales bacterium]|nr:hypothetical protein [Sphingomonadales bacterium]MBU3991731.1 hypothetical protein [Alphaproteobacteria bacterium]
MTRALLAFLALLGLVAQAAPAQARVCASGTPIGIVAQTRAASLALAARTAAIVRPAFTTGTCHRPALAEVFPVLQAQAVVPAVLIGVDRASE